MLSVSFNIAMRSSLLTPSNKDSMPSATSAFAPMQKKKKKERKNGVCVCFSKANPAVKRARRVQETLWNAWPPGAPGDARAAQERSPAPTAAESSSLGSTVNKTPVRQQAALDIREKQIKNKTKQKNLISHLPLVTGIRIHHPSNACCQFKISTESLRERSLKSSQR